MVSVDFRTRLRDAPAPVDPAAFVAEDGPRLIDLHGSHAAAGMSRYGLPPLTLEVEGERITFARNGSALGVSSGGNAPLVASMDRVGLAELLQDTASTFGLQMTGRARIVEGSVDDFIGWEPVLRTFLDGRPVYEPGSIELRAKDGSPLDLRRSFTLDDSDEEIGHFLAEAGFLHIAGGFTEEEMAAVSADLDRAIAAARRDDGASWWACTEAGEWYASRILGFNQKSASLRELLGRDRFRRIGTFTDDVYVQRPPDHGDSAEGLLKKVGVTEGISDVSWHKDCAMGGHSRGCCGLTVGISVTGARRENGELGVVAGSHRANVAALGIEGLDLPRLPLPTTTGDLTVHCSCTLHMSRPPVSAERRVVYTGFGLAPRDGDRPVVVDEAEIRRQRAVLNDHVLDRHGTDRASSARLANFDL